MFFDTKISNLPEQYYLEPGLHQSITDIVEAFNTIIRKRHNHTESTIGVKESGTTQKNEIHLANEGSGLAFVSRDLGSPFGNNVGNDFGVLFIKKRPHKPEFAYDIFCIHSLVIDTDLIEY